MMRKAIATKAIATLMALAMLAALMPTTLADSGGVKPYEGWVGADSPLYPIKILIQHLDVYITLNNTDKMVKEMRYADERLSEAMAAALANNTRAVNASLDELEEMYGEIDKTSQAIDINDTEYANLSPMLYHHQQCFYALLNNSSPNVEIQGRCMIVNGTITKMKNGMPYYYYNGTAYFIPPGQARMLANGTMPPGLAKKGYLRPVPTIANGSVSWPWDELQYSYNTTEHGKNKAGGKGNGNGRQFK